MAKYLGAYVIAIDTASNRNLVVSLGADEYIDYQTHRFDELIKDVDFVLEAIGGESFARSLNVVKPKGTIVSLVTNVDEGSKQLAKEKGIKGSFHMSVKSSGKDLKEIARLLEKGIIKSHISKTYSFDQMVEAHLQIESGRTVGKIVVIL